MTAVSYTTKAGVKQFRPVLDGEELAQVMLDGAQGFCLACGVEADGVEPDARRRVCEACGAAKVYGLEELAIMGLLTTGGAE